MCRRYEKPGSLCSHTPISLCHSYFFLLLLLLPLPFSWLLFIPTSCSNVLKKKKVFDTSYCFSSLQLLTANRGHASFFPASPTPRCWGVPSNIALEMDAQVMKGTMQGGRSQSSHMKCKMIKPDRTIKSCAAFTFLGFFFQM